MVYFYIYLLQQNFREWIITIGIAFLVIIWFWGFMNLVNLWTDADSKVYKVPTYLKIITFSMLIIGTVIPSKETLTYWWAYYIGRETIQSEPVQKLYKILNLKLDEELTQLLAEETKK